MRANGCRSCGYGWANSAQFAGCGRRCTCTAPSPQWVWFVADYFCFERVQLFTFDIIEERVRLKLIVGCLALYPVLYPVALWGTAGLASPDIDRA